MEEQMNEPVSLQPWSIDDFPVLERSNTPEMTSFLGGPESAEKLVSRHAKFLRPWEAGEARMFTVRIGPDDEAVGSVGYWQTRWADSDVYETGWSIATAHQGRGIATSAVRACLRYAAAHGDRRVVVAYPRIDNLASNALCRSAGFTYRGEEAIEYPPGTPIRANVWSFDLAELRS
jgi:RimJ/RimL family protein N-acetyltransferase